MRQGLMIVAFVALSIAALTGWTRHVSVTGATPATAFTPVSNTQSCTEPPADQVTATVPPVYASMPYGTTSTSRPVTQYAAPQPPLPPPYIADEQAFANEGVVRRQYRTPPRTRVVYYSRRARHRRPFSHSAAIVAGTAAAGAGIGALAGGGRGAGIGALAGGGAGLVYDRLTH
jgi:hypothetical protein